MRHHLLPVWGYSRFASSARDLCLGPNEWWGQAPLHYPHALISYVHWKKPFTFPDGAYIFGDSGGFTLRSPTRLLKIDPVDVVHWQSSLCTVGCILDLPPGQNESRIWQEGLDVTAEHTRAALPEYNAMRASRSSFRWWGVLHGNNETEVRQYHNAIATVYPFEDDGEGWAIRAEPNVNLYSVARSLRVLKDLGIKRAHFLAATSQKVIAVLLVLGPQSGLELLTYDSAYAVKYGLHRGAFIPGQDGVAFTLMREKRQEHHVRDYLLKCPCAACAHMRERSERVTKARAEIEGGRFAGWWSSWLQLHNLYVQQQLTDAQARVADSDPDQLLRAMLTTKEYSLVMQIFERDGHEPNTVVATSVGRSLLDYV